MSVAIGSSSQALSMYCVFIWSPANLVWLRWGEQTAHLKSILRKCFRLCCSWPRIIVHTHYVSDVLFFSMTVHHNNWYFVRLYQILLSLSSRTGFCVCPKGGGQIWEKQLKSTSYSSFLNIFTPVPDNINPDRMPAQFLYHLTDLLLTFIRLITCSLALFV